MKQFAETELGVTRMNFGQQNNIELRLISLAVHAVSLRYNFLTIKYFCLHLLLILHIFLNVFRMQHGKKNDILQKSSSSMIKQPYKTILNNAEAVILSTFKCTLCFLTTIIVFQTSNLTLIY